MFIFLEQWTHEVSCPFPPPQSSSCHFIYRSNLSFRNELPPFLFLCLTQWSAGLANAFSGDHLGHFSLLLTFVLPPEKTKANYRRTLLCSFSVYALPLPRSPQDSFLSYDHFVFIPFFPTALTKGEIICAYFSPPFFFSFDGVPLANCEESFSIRPSPFLFTPRFSAF